MGKEIEISQVKSATLKLIVEYLKQRYAYFKEKNEFPPEIVKPIRSDKMGKIAVDFEAEFIEKLTKGQIFKIILGANYMDIQSLLYLGCAKIATLIKGKSPEEIKKILGDGEDGAVVNNLVQNAGLVEERRRLLEAMANFSK